MPGQSTTVSGTEHFDGVKLLQNEDDGIFEGISDMDGCILGIVLGFKTRQ